MLGRLLVNFHLNLLDCFVRIGFSPDTSQQVQPANHGFVQRFCVNNNTVFGLVAVLQTDNAFADRHDNSEDWILVGGRGVDSTSFATNQETA